ncbi:hypothetical protein [Dishui Lake large algae virus 1]|nr:hypothetical protein [Dishui Lake large algae virus 1]
MQGPSILLRSDDEDDILEIGANDNTRPFHIPEGSGMPQMPRPFTSPSQPSNGSGFDPLINRRKVSSDVLSRSSGQDSRENSDYGSDSESDDETESYVSDAPPQRQQYQSRPQNNSMPSNNFGGAYADPMAARMASERSRMETEMNEKREILYQLERLENKGFKLPRRFTVQSDLEEMRAEFHRILREKEVDASVRFQRKMMMALVTGIEFLNTRFDPFDVKLDGWSEQVHENINDYDDIFEELHDKYKGTGKKMAPELRLMMSLSGSAFMFHLTNSMFKKSPLPGVEEVLRANPDLMKQFQQASVNQLGRNIMGGGQAPPQQGGGGGMSGLFGMMSNLMGGNSGGNRGSSMPPPPNMSSKRPAPPQQREVDIENIINDIHEEISIAPPGANSNRIETISLDDDDEIASILESVTSDVMNAKKQNASRKQGGGGGRRTLNL